MELDEIQAQYVQQESGVCEKCFAHFLWTIEQARWI